MAPSTKDKADKAQGANQFFKLVDRSRLSRPERERGRIDRKGEQLAKICGHMAY